MATKKAQKKKQIQEPEPVKTSTVEKVEFVGDDVTYQAGVMSNINIPGWLYEILEGVAEELKKTREQVIIDALKFHLGLYISQPIEEPPDGQE